MTSSSSTPKKNGSVVFADSRYKYGAVETDLIVPHTTRDDKNMTIGGNMCVPLKALVISGTRHELSDFPKLKPYGVVVCLDTGSEGYFVVDDTGGTDPSTGKDYPSVSELVGGSSRVMGDGSGTYEIIIGGSDGKSEFSVRLPEAWRDFPHQPGFGSAVQRPPFRSQSQSRSQMFLVGNLWLQAVSITFAPYIGKVYFANLDAKGRRAPHYLGPVDAPAASSAAVNTSPFLGGQQSPFGNRSLPPFWRSDGYTGTSLTEQAFQPAGLAPGEEPRSNVSVPIKFMIDPKSSPDFSEQNVSTPSIEAPDAQYVSQPCLEVIVPVPGGGTRTITQVADTGSGITLILGAAGMTDPKDDCDDCGCVGIGQSQDLGTLFREYSPKAGTPRQCQNPSRDAGCGAGCCTECCLGATDVDGNPVDANTKVRCAVCYCTGLVQYKPAFIQATFPGSPEGLSNVRIFAGRAAAVCEPAVKDGVWGCWYWANEEQTQNDTVLKDSSTLPFYVLRSLGQEGGELGNMTWNFWRSDLGLCKEVKGGVEEEGPPQTPQPSPSPQKSHTTTAAPPPLKVHHPPVSSPQSAVIANPFIDNAERDKDNVSDNINRSSGWSTVGISMVASLGVLVAFLLVALLVLMMVRASRGN